MSYSSSINTGLQQVPDLTDIQSVGKLSFQFIQIYNAMAILAQSIDSYTGNSPATSSSSSTPPEQTILVGNTANMWCIATEAISPGFLVSLSNVSGVTKCTLATGLTLSTIALGLSMTAAAGAGSSIQILLLGLFNFGGSVTPGALYYTDVGGPAGAITTTAPTTTGQLVQPIGYGVDTDSIFFNPCLNPQPVPAAP